MQLLLHRFRIGLGRTLDGWGITAIFILLLLSVPLWILAWNFFGNPESEIWDHLKKTVLSGYISNTLSVVGGVTLITLVVGVSSAWIVTAYDFPLRKFFEWSLVLPLAIPPYVAAYTYTGIFDYTSPIEIYTSDLLGYQNTYADIMSMRNLIIILGFVMFPYVYLITRASFIQQASGVIETSRLLGRSTFSTFFSVVLPLARPAIAGGLILVTMELLNDYGAMKYFGVDTFTVAICQVWFSFSDLNTAIRLAIYLMLVSLVIIMIERFMRGKVRYSGSSRQVPLRKIRLKGIKAGLAFMLCFLPFFLGFIIPVIQLIVWTATTFKETLKYDFVTLIQHSFFLAITAALIAVFFSIIVVYAVRLKKNKLMKFMLRSVNAGYAIPGAVIAIGVMIPFIYIHNTLVDVFGKNYNMEHGLMVGGIIAVLFAYIVRFLVLAVNPVEAGFEKVNQNIEEASRSLGASSLRTLWKIDMPVMKPAILASAIFVFVSVLKEIPVTIIIRPFNFETLATKSFEMAKNELLAQSAGMSLVIVLAGLIPVIILNKLFTRQQG